MARRTATIMNAKNLFVFLVVDLVILFSPFFKETEKTVDGFFSCVYFACIGCFWTVYLLANADASVPTVLGVFFIVKP